MRFLLLEQSDKQQILVNPAHIVFATDETKTDGKAASRIYVSDETSFITAISLKELDDRIDAASITEVTGRIANADSF